MNIAAVAILFSLIRHGLTIVGPLLATKGIDVAEVIPAIDGLEQAVGLTLTAIGVGLSIFDKLKTNRAAA